MQECLYAEMQCDVRYGCWAAMDISVVFQAYMYMLIHIMNVAAYSLFKVFSPDCTLHTAITHVISVLERWSLM